MTKAESSIAIIRAGARCAIPRNRRGPGRSLGKGRTGAFEGRSRDRLLQTRDRIDSDVLPLTQEFLSQMLGAHDGYLARPLDRRASFKIVGVGSLVLTARDSKTWHAITPLPATKTRRTA
jgi:hypothetical protein